MIYSCPIEYTTLTRLLLIYQSPWLVARRVAWTERVIDSQLSTIVLLSAQGLHGLHSTLDINEICVSETSWLASPSIDCDSDINDIANTSEKVVKISVGHLKRHVTNEEGLARWVDWSELSALTRSSPGCAIGVSKVHSQTTTLEDLLVHRVDSSLCLLGIAESKVAKSERLLAASNRSLCQDSPFAQTS